MTGTTVQILKMRGGTCDLRSYIVIHMVFVLHQRMCTPYICLMVLGRFIMCIDDAFHKEQLVHLSILSLDTDLSQYINLSEHESPAR